MVDPSTCHVIMDGVELEKQVGDVWSSTDDLCLKHTCELDQTGGPIESTFSEYCSHACLNVCKFYVKFIPFQTIRKYFNL